MLRYKTETRPDLVALYDIWPGNGAGQFLQPCIPHGAGSLKGLQSRTCVSCWIGIFYKPDSLPVAQPTASKHWRIGQQQAKMTYAHFWTYLSWTLPSEVASELTFCILSPETREHGCNSYDLFNTELNP